MLIVKNVAGDVDHLDHSSFLVVEPDEISDFKLDVFGFRLLDDFIDLDADFWSFHLKKLIDGELLIAIKFNFSFAALTRSTPNCL